jgi:hypothetical protein
LYFFIDKSLLQHTYTRFLETVIVPVARTAEAVTIKVCNLHEFNWNPKDDFQNAVASFKLPEFTLNPADLLTPIENAKQPNTRSKRSDALLLARFNYVESKANFCASKGIDPSKIQIEARVNEPFTSKCTYTTRGLFESYFEACLDGMREDLYADLKQFAETSSKGFTFETLASHFKSSTFHVVKVRLLAISIGVFTECCKGEQFQNACKNDKYGHLHVVEMRDTDAFLNQSIYAIVHALLSGGFIQFETDLQWTTAPSDANKRTGLQNFEKIQLKFTNKFNKIVEPGDFRLPSAEYLKGGFDYERYRAAKQVASVSNYLFSSKPPQQEVKKDKNSASEKKDFPEQKAPNVADPPQQYPLRNQQPAAATASTVKPQQQQQQNGPTKPWRTVMPPPGMSDAKKSSNVPLSSAQKKETLSTPTPQTQPPSKNIMDKPPSKAIVEKPGTQRLIPSVAAPVVVEQLRHSVKQLCSIESMLAAAMSSSNTTSDNEMNGLLSIPQSYDLGELINYELPAATGSSSYNSENNLYFLDHNQIVSVPDRIKLLQMWKDHVEPLERKRECALNLMTLVNTRISETLLPRIEETKYSFANHGDSGLMFAIPTIAPIILWTETETEAWNRVQMENYCLVCRGDDQQEESLTDFVHCDHGSIEGFFVNLFHVVRRICFQFDDSLLGNHPLRIFKTAGDAETSIALHEFIRSFLETATKEKGGLSLVDWDLQLSLLRKDLTH